MQRRRIAACAVAGATALLAGCWSAPPPLPDEASDFEWSAPLDLGARDRGFFRFDIPDSAPAYARQKRDPYFGAFEHVAVVDADGRLMACGAFDRGNFLDAHPERHTTGLLTRSVTQYAVPARLSPEAARKALCTNEQGEISVFCKIAPDGSADVYEADFDATGDAIRASLVIEWSAAPDGGTVEILPFLGEGTPMPIRADANANDPSSQTIAEGSMRLVSPLYFRTRGTPAGFVPERLDVQASLRRADRSVHWFEASGTPPYRLLIDERNGRCATPDAYDALPPEAANADWPPVATAGTVSKNARSTLDALTAGIAPRWRLWAEYFALAYVAGLIMALAYRWAARQKA